MSTRERLARIGAALACVCTSLALVIGPTPTAAANSATGLANNAWLVSELAVQAAGAYQTPAAQYASAAELAAASTATRPSVPSPGFTSRPSPSSKLGLVLNGIAVFGTAAFMFNPFDDDAPEIPVGTAGESFIGAPDTGWCAGICTGVSRNTATNSNFQFSSAGVQVRNGKKSVWYEFRNANTNQVTSTLDVNVPDPSFSLNLSRQAYPRQFYVLQNECLDQFCNTWGRTQDVLATGFLPATGSTMPDPSSPSSTPESVPRYIDSTITCKSPGGGSQVITRTDGPFTFDPAVGGDLVDVPFMECPPGTWLDSGTRDLRTDGSTTTVPMEVYDAPPWVDTQATRFPECFPVGNLACQLDLVFVSVGGDEKQCSSYPVGAEHPCYQWLRDPDRDTRYDCKFGPYTIGLRACRPLKHAYAPSPTISPSEPLDPVAPNPDDPEVVDPDAPPVDPTPETTPDLNADGCIPTGWDVLNPFAYFKATACALKWAFVPKVGLSTRLDQIGTAVSTKIPFSWLAPLSVIANPAIGQSCPDWRVKVADLDTNVVCGSSFTDAVRAARPVLLGFMGLLAVWPLVRSTAYAAFPIIKPQPGMLR